MCASFNYDGYTDWFLPSLDELDLMYKNLAMKGLGGFTGDWYWSSSELSIGYVWEQRFSDGRQGYYYLKDGTSCIRAVRAF
ncbi:hypothetical protein FACS189491_00040 [Spirochaetia bacterium]|nr:hypothetical protein FACS189491_00040 [Spirochaetia bacterium]